MRFLPLTTGVLPLLLLAMPAQAQQQLGDVIGQLLGVSGDASLARCESLNGKPQTCKIQSGTRLEFVRQLSKTACVQGKTMAMVATQVTVSGGCRAEFRVIQADASNTTQVEAAIAQALRNAVKQPSGEYGSLYEVRVQTANPMNGASGSQQVYTGAAQAIWGGRAYPLEYTARLEKTTGRFLNVDYRYNASNTSDGDNASWNEGSALDAQARAALESAIEAEYKRRSGVRSAQVTVNDAYREQQITRSDYRFSGKYGVSVNDADWQTDHYQGRVFLPRNAVSELQIGPTR